MGKKGSIIGGIIGIIALISVLASIGNLINIQNEVKQSNQELNNATENLLNVCSEAKSVMDLSGCKTSISNIKTQCKDPQYSSMAVCSNPRIDEFFTTYDSKLSYAEGVISNAQSDVINACVELIASGGINQQCISDMQNIQQACNQFNIDNHIASCSDPRINEIMNGITQPSISQVNNSVSGNNASTTSNQNPLSTEDMINNCAYSPSETCNYQMADLYQNCSAVPTQLNQCNTKVVLYLIKNAVILDSSGKVVYYQKGLTEPDGRIIPRQFLSADEDSAYFNDEPSYDMRLLYQQLNPSYVHPKWDANTAGLNVLAFCQGSTSVQCNSAIVALSGFCYNQPALFPVCGDERIAEYLIKQNLADQVIRQPYFR